MTYDFSVIAHGPWVQIIGFVEVDVDNTAVVACKPGMDACVLAANFLISKLSVPGITCYV